ncbi:MAG: hypothetical protein ACLPSH_16210 [Vulcanimicrobiaceae bacterium]
MAMALVAILGAATAYSASRDELIGSTCERKFDESRNYELAQRQEYLDRAFVKLTLDDRYNMDVNLARLQRDEAAQARLHRSPEALDPGILDTDAQLNYAAARLLRHPRTFLNYTVGTEPFEESLDLVAEKDARNLGLLGSCVPRRAAAAPAAQAKNPDLLEAMEGDIAVIRDRSVQSAAAVVIFVLSLSFFTLSEVVPEKRRLILEVCAYAICVIAVVYALVVDPSLLLVFAITVLCFIGLGAAAWAFISRLKIGASPAVAAAPAHEDEEELPELHEFDREGFVGKHIHFVPVRNRFGAIVVCLIALSALLSALGAYGYARSSAYASDAAARALQEQTLMIKDKSRLDIEAYYVLQNDLLLAESRLREHAASFLEAQSRTGAIPDRGDALWNAEAARWGSTLDLLTSKNKQTEQVILEQFESDQGPYEDAHFPDREVYARTTELPARELALWDAQDELSSAWSQKASLVLAALTVFAIALYLFGQSLGMGQTPGAYVLTFFAGLLLVFGAGLGAWAKAQQPPNIDGKVAVPSACQGDGALTDSLAGATATCYSAAELAYNLAYLPQDYQKALTLYRATVTLRPEFAVAAYRAATVFSLMSGSQLQGSYTSLHPKSAFPEMAQQDATLMQELQARGLSSSAGVYASSGFDDYMVALENGDKNVLASSIDKTRRSLALDDTRLFVRYNLGLALLADGKRPEGLATYASAIADSDNASDEVYSGVVTDLELLRVDCPKLEEQAYCDALQSDIDGLEDRIIAAAWPKPVSAEVGSVSSDGLDFQIFPGGIEWSSRRPFSGIDAHNVLIAVAYRRDPEWGSWYVLPDDSYEVDPSALNFYRNGGGFGDFYTNGTVGDCLPSDGRYRLDLYLNGRRVARKEIDGGKAGPHLAGIAFWDVGVTMCYPDLPPPWHELINETGTLVHGVAADNRRMGAVVFGFVAPRQSSDQAKRKVERDMARRAIAYLLRGRTSAGVFGLSSMRCNEAGRWNGSHVSYVSAGLVMLAKASVRGDGYVNVGVVWQPPSAEGRTSRSSPVLTDLSCRVLTSIQPLDMNVER